MLVSQLIIITVPYILPPLLIVTDAVPFAWRFYILTLITGLLGFYAYWNQYQPDSMGLTLTGLVPSLKINICLTIAVLAVISTAYYYDLFRTIPFRQSVLFGLFYVLISCPAQEFAYRGFLFEHLKRMGVENIVLIVLITSFLYAFMHIIYRDWLTVSLTFIIGLAWGGSYAWAPNLLGVTVSHAFVGLASFLLGLV